MTRFVALIATPFFLVPAWAGAQEVIPIGTLHSLTSEVLDEERTIQVYLPRGYEESTGLHPLVVLLDGEFLFPQVAGIADGLAESGVSPGLIVVGIRNTNRNRDLLPTSVSTTPGSGGADDFLDFIEDELLPFVESRFRTAPFRVLVGHSFGGLFVTHALAERPDLFEAGVAVSPALWWDGRLMTRDTDRLARQDVAGRLFLSLGDEPDLMAGAFDDFVGALEGMQLDSRTVEVRRYPGEDHMSTTLPALYDGLRFVFDGWQMPRTLVDEGAQAVRDYYAELSLRFGYTVAAPASLLARLDALPEEVQLPRSTLERYVGDYAHSPQFIATVGLDERGLFISAQGASDKQRIFPSSETEFFFREFDGRLTFRVDASGQITHYVMVEGNGAPMEAERVR